MARGRLTQKCKVPMITALLARNDAPDRCSTLALIAEGDLHTAAMDLAGGDIAGAVDFYLDGYEYLDVVVPELTRSVTGRGQ
jgi:hypothetical protein